MTLPDLPRPIHEFSHFFRVIGPDCVRVMGVVGAGRGEAGTALCIATIEYEDQGDSAELIRKLRDLAAASRKLLGIT